MWSTSDILPQISLMLPYSQFAAFVKNPWFMVMAARFADWLDYIMSNSTIFIVFFGTGFLAEWELDNNILLLVISRSRFSRSS